MNDPTVILLGSVSIATLVIFAWAGVRAELSAAGWAFLAWVFIGICVAPTATALFHSEPWAAYLMPGFLLCSAFALVLRSM